MGRTRVSGTRSRFPTKCLTCFLPLHTVWIMPPATRTERRVLGGAVRRIRTLQGYALDPVAKKAGISAGYWCNIEAGRKQPTQPLMQKMAAALAVDLDDITYTTTVLPISDEDAA